MVPMKLLMMKGLPGSGKSTKAKEIALAQGNTVRVNKDLLREMLHFGRWLPQNEPGIWEVERSIAAYYLSEQKQNVIIDDTNLTPGHEEKWRDFVNNLQRKGLTELEFDVCEMKTDVFTCIERDAERGAAGGRMVGQSVIMQMALENELMDKGIHYVLVDMDGTLADLEHRRQYVNFKCDKCGGNGLDGQPCDFDNIKHARKNWPKFYEELSKDTLRQDVLDQVEATLATARDEGKRTFFIVLSARPENYRKETEDWMERMGIDDYSALIMRRAGDSREDSIVKRELLNKYFKDKSKIIKVFDDRPRVIRMWREEGLDVVDVGDGIEF